MPADWPVAFNTLIVVLGTGSALYFGFRAVRKIVHVLDAIERSSSKVERAVDLVISEFAVNGGRIVDYPLSEERAQKATVKDLLLDIRTALIATGKLLEQHEKNVGKRVSELRDEIRTAR